MSLLEVMIAIAVISVALLGTMSVFINAERLNSVSREESIAQAAICQIISKIRATRFVNLVLTQPTGFTGGAYGAGERLLPATYPVDVGGDQLARGVQISTTPATGFIQMGARFYAPAPGAAEMRVMMINDEDPVESEIGEIAGNQDGCDLDQNGSISTAAFPIPIGWTSSGANPSVGPEGVPLGNSVTFDQFPQAAAPNTYDANYSRGGATPLFPRRLASGTANGGANPVHQYLNINQMLIMPVIVQVRWWSNAGVPREITVITFLTNRS